YTPPGVPIWHARSEIGYPFLRCLVYILVRKIRFALSVLARLANCVSPGQVFVIRGEFLLHRFISSRLRGSRAIVKATRGLEQRLLPIRVPLCTSIQS